VPSKPSFIRRLRLLGSGTNAVGWTEILVSALSATLGILLVYVVSVWFLEGLAVLFVAASMGSSAVLLFAVPHGSMSQPWPLFGGHLVSGLTGVTCAVLLPQPALAAALAVGLSIGLMQLFRCVHAPGGATALAAALGGSTVYGMGYLFVVAPIMFNVLILFTAAVVANYPFKWRRYPVALLYPHHEGEPPQTAPREEDLSWAIEQMNVIVDVTAEELHEIAERALAHARKGQSESVTLRLGPRLVRAHRPGEVPPDQAPNAGAEAESPVVSLKLVPQDAPSDPDDSRS
jgi:CBS domain-containing membrane protein